jgi:hypothetical protein
MYDKNEKRTQNGQEFKRATDSQLHVGNVVWKQSWDINTGHNWLEGPYFIVEIVYEGRISQYYRLFSTHDAYESAGKWGELWIPIIDTIKPPRGHNGTT